MKTAYIYPDAYIKDKRVKDMTPEEKEDFKDYMMINYNTQVIYARQ